MEQLGFGWGDDEGEKPDPPVPEPRARKSDPDTSHEAARVAGFVQREQHAKILAYLYDGDAPVSDIADAIFGVGANRDSISPRMNEMVKLGLIARTGEKRVPRDPEKRVKQTVWGATAHGRAVYERSLLDGL